MSKTDRHRPFKVQVSDSPREWHDHSKGPCDLLPLEEWMKLGRRQDWAYRCGWQPSNWPTYKGFGRTTGERYWRKKDREQRDKRKEMKEDYDY